ncbi:hypothetical protein C0J52_02246, partial [Blattella germanica]
YIYDQCPDGHTIQVVIFYSVTSHSLILQIYNGHSPSGSMLFSHSRHRHQLLTGCYNPSTRYL